VARPELCCQRIGCVRRRDCAWHELASSTDIHTGSASTSPAVPILSIPTFGIPRSSPACSTPRSFLQGVLRHYELASRTCVSVPPVPPSNNSIYSSSRIAPLGKRPVHPRPVPVQWGPKSLRIRSWPVGRSCDYRYPPAAPPCR